MSAELVHVTVEQVDTLLQSAEEGILLLFHHAGDEFLLLQQFGISLAHLLHEHGHEFIHEGALLSEERVGIANGTAQDAADDVAGLGVGGQLTVGDREGNGAQVVGHDAHGDVDLLLLVGTLTVGACGHGVAVLLAREELYLLDDGLEDVGVVVGVLALQHAHEALEAHAGIDDVHGQRLQFAVGLTVELHEHDVPDLNHLRIVLVDEFASRHFCLFLIGT